MKNKSQSPEISLAFLDIMSCGFGAFILLFLIIKHNFDAVAELPEDYLDKEIASLENQNLNILKQIETREKENEALKERIMLAQQALSTKKVELSERVQLIKNWDDNRIRGLDTLRFEIKKAEKAQQTLENTKKNTAKDNLKFIGQGNREYLSGIKSGGNNILILLDISASMLDKKIVNILRRRNIDGRKRVNSRKWQQAISTVEWISARFPFASKYQILIFNENCRSLLGKKPAWQRTSDTEKLEEAIQQTKRLRPEGGTNLYKAFTALNALQPLPDNVFLITDGLPTLGRTQTGGLNVDGKTRLKLFEEATGILSKEIPINVILLPMEGDPLAAWAYWGIASVTNGSFLSPSGDWP